MELTRIERKEVPTKFGERLVSTYSLSAEDLVHIAGFSATRDLSAAYGKDCAPNDPDSKKSRSMVQESSRALNPIIAQLFLPQDFKSYTPMIFYKGINLQLRGPQLSLSLSKDEKVILRPTFFIDSQEDILEIETYLQNETGTFRSTHDSYLPILVDVYKRINNSADGTNLPILGINGLGIEVAEARLARKATEKLQEIAERTTIKRLDDLRELRGGITDEERKEEKRETIMRAFRREYDRLMSEI